jgi:hypothetical protein
MATKKVLDVVKVGFHGHTGDDRSPESFLFPSCMASLLQYLKEDYPIKTIYSHGRSYSMRTANNEILSASGMAFALLWHPTLCMSSTDLMIAIPHEKAIQRGFAWAGYAYDEIENSKNSIDLIKKRITDSIDRNIPVLAFGIFNIPECYIIAGYDNDGDTLIGWSHFQAFNQCSVEKNGMFRKDIHDKDIWKYVILAEKMKRSLTVNDVFLFGAGIMKMTSVDGYYAGAKVYDEWIKMILGSKDADDATLKSNYKFHHAILFNLAEARCWGGEFMNAHDETVAGNIFNNIHDECWKTDTVTGREGWEGLKIGDNLQRIAALLKGIKNLDELAYEHLAKNYK